MKPRPLHPTRRIYALAVSLAIGCSTNVDSPRAEDTSETGCPGIAGETVRWVVPYSVGGGYDVYSRLLEPFYEEAIGAEILIQNRDGAGGRVGARVIQTSDPDGRTMGLVNGFALLVNELTGTSSGLALTGFTVLGRLAPVHPVWVTSSESSLRTVDDLLARAETQPILVGLTDLGSTGFSSVSLGADLLGIDLDYVAGYQGSRETSLGLLRGEFDLLGVSFESVIDRVEDGSLLPILQISDVPAFEHPALADVPLLAGPDGVAVEEALAGGEDPDRALAVAASASRLFSTGRLVVGPAGLNPALARCLADRLAEVAQDSAFLRVTSQAQRGFAFQEADTVLSRVEAMADDRRALSEMLRRHAELVSGGANGP